MLEGGPRAYAWSGVCCCSLWDGLGAVQSEQKTEGAEEKKGRLRQALEVFWNAAEVTTHSPHGLQLKPLPCFSETFGPVPKENPLSAG